MQSETHKKSPTEAGLNYDEVYRVCHWRHLMNANEDQ